MISIPIFLAVVRSNLDFSHSLDNFSLPWFPCCLNRVKHGERGERGKNMRNNPSFVIISLGVHSVIHKDIELLAYTYRPDGAASVVVAVFYKHSAPLGLPLRLRSGFLAQILCLFSTSCPCVSNCEKNQKCFEIRLQAH